MVTQLAICGLHQGMDHVEACLDHEAIRIVALVDECQDKRNDGWEKIGTKYPNIPQKSYKGLRELANDDSMKDKLHGVILALPHHVYPEEWDCIMQLGVPILKEKPLSRNVPEANQFLHQAHTRGIGLMLAIQRRYHPAYRTLRKLIVQQNMAVRSMRIVYKLGISESSESKGWRGDPQKSGGGMLLDAGYHMVDIVQFLVGTGHLVSATLTKDVDGREVPCSREEIEEHCYLTIGKDSMLISIECHLSGTKTERVMVDTEDENGQNCRIELERGPKRFTVTEPSGKVREFERDWRPALERQIQKFVENISKHSFDIHSQLPVQRIVHDAYALADQFSFGVPDRPKDEQGERR